MNWIKKLFSKEKREMNQSVNTDEEPNHIEGDFTIFNKLESIFEDLPVVSTNGKEQLVNKFKRKIIDYGGFIAPIDGCSEILRSGLKGIAEVRKQPRSIAIDADKIAEEIGNKRVSNVVILGAATPFIQIAPEKIEAGIKRIFDKKGDTIVEMNLKAFHAGRQFALENS